MPFFFLDLVVAWIELSVRKKISCLLSVLGIHVCVLLGLHTRLLLLSLFFSFHVSCPSLCSLFCWRKKIILLILGCLLCIVFFPLWLSSRCFFPCSSLLAAVTSLVSSFYAVFRITNPCVLLGVGSTKLDFFPVEENASSINQFSSCCT